LADSKLSRRTHPEPDSEKESSRSYWASFRCLTDWLYLFSLLVTLGIVIWGVQQAKWISPSPSLIIIFAFSLLVGFLLSKTRFSDLTLLAPALIAGLIVVFWQSLVMYSDESLVLKASHLIGDIRLWWRAESFGAPIPVTIHIALIFSYLTWIIGYFSIWTLIRYRNPWVAVFLGTVIVLVNLNFLSSQKYYYYLAFVIAALIFIFLVIYTRQRSLLSKNINRHGWGSLFWIGAGCCFIAIAVFVSWSNPGYRIGPVSDYARAHSPFKNDIELYWQNFFAQVPGTGAPKLIHGGQQEFLFGGSLDLSDQVVFIINSNQEYYWKTQIYDYYASMGWKSSAAADKTLEKTNSSEIPLPSSTQSNTMSYVVIPQVNTNVIPVTGNFETADISVVEKILNPQTFIINLNDSSNDNLLPSDIAEVAKSIRAARSLRRRVTLDQQIASAMPDNLKLVSTNRSGSTVQSITVARSQSDENDNRIIAVSSAQTLAAQQQAAITVQIPPVATNEQLSRVSGKYPEVITDRYLQLPLTLPDRVKELAKSVTEKTANPYEKVEAITNYLSTYPYTLTINAPPPDADGVDYFLFTQKSGYCTYFASAMTVMLRSVGIPARMVVGFIPGLKDSATNSYFIRDRDYHAWVEVYYPGFGWIQVDPTPGNTTTQSDIIPNTADNPVPPSEDFPSEVSPDTPATPEGPNYYFIFGAVIAAALAFLILLIIWRRFYGRPKDIRSVYEKMVLLASVSGIGPKRWQTTLEFSNELSRVIPEQSSLINEISQAYTLVTYSDRPVEHNQISALITAWPELRKCLFNRVLNFKRVVKRQ
jgi:transglutaminase-like putative cysteine protease